MNCSRFRFLIQQWFDTPLSPQDERMVMAHLETCDSCARFQHQLDQVIQSTPEVALPDECLPSNLEALAKRIMVEIPQEKPGFMSMLKGLLPFGNGKGQQQPKKEKQVKEPVETSGGGFPHVRRKQLEDQDPNQQNAVRSGGARKQQQQQQQYDEDLLATSTRLKSLQKLQPASEDPQAMTSSRLGHKFGVNLPDPDIQQDGPGGVINLAESIRRKMVEDNKTPSGDWQATSNPQDFSQLDQQGFPGAPGGPAAFGQQPGFGGGQQGLGQQPGFGQPAPQAGFGAPPAFGQPPQPRFGAPAPGPAQAPGMVGQWADTTNAPAQPGGWGDPPTPGVGGDSDWKPTPPGADWSIAKPQNSTWGGQPQQQQPQPQTGGQDPAWGSEWPEDADFENQRKPAPPTVPQGQWGQTQSGDNWGAQGQSGDNWAAAAQQQSGDNWGAAVQKQSGDGWGAAAPAVGAPANDGWGAPSGGAGGGWGAPAPAAQAAPQGQQGGWGAPSGANGANDDWGNPAPKQDSGWGAPQTATAQAPTAPANAGWGGPIGSAANDGWGNAQAAPSNDGGWGATQQAAAPAPAPVPANDGWGAPAPQQPPTGNGGWGGAKPQESGGWGTAPQDGWSAPAAQTPATSSWGGGAQQEGGWGAPAAPAASDWSNSPQQPTPAGGNPFLTASPAPAAPAKPTPTQDLDAWSEEGEQIQTGMWQAFTLDEPALGTPKGLNQTGQAGTRPVVPPPQQAAETANRWDTPIQQRPPEPEPADRWDVPISERMAQQQAAPAPGPMAAPPVSPPAPAAVPPQPPADRWDTPIQQRPPTAPPPLPQAAPAAADGDGKNSIMDRLNSILGDDLEALASTSTPGRPAPAAPAAPMAPVATPPAVPVVPAPQAPADPNQYDIPIQERMKQQAAVPVPTPEPVAAAAGLFKLDDQAIDNMFSKIGVNDGPPGAPAAAPAAASAPAPVPPVPGLPAMAAPPVPPPVPPMGAAPVAPPMRPMTPPAVPPVAPVAPAPMAPPVVPQPVAAQAPAAAQQQAGMFKLDDQAIDNIFSNNLGLKDSAPAKPVVPSPAPTAPVPPVLGSPTPPPVPAVGAPGAPKISAVPPRQPAAQQPQGSPAMRPPVPPVAPQQQAGGWNAAPQQPVAPAPVQPSVAAAKGDASGLFNVDDAAMDRIFNDLGVKEKPGAVPKINVREAVSQIRTLADVPTPKVEGVGRLSREPEPASDAAPGKINAIGKFLLDQQDLQKIGNLTQSDLSDGKVRVLTHEASDEINKLLEHIGTQPGVVGSVIVGHDGILIANSLPKEHDPETIGILSLGIYVNTTNIAKKIGHNHLHQLVSRTPHGFLVIADFGGGILVTVSNGQETDKLIPLMRSITQLVAQS